MFALLGHNGAGKTSLLNMITGLSEPTAGAAYLDDLDIFEHQDTFRQSLGFCPQHNVLFPSLTVREHLELFCQLRGAKQVHALNRQVDRMISEIELDEV